MISLIKQMNHINNNINKSITKLSTGKRINSASDSPSDILRISKLNSQIRGSQVAQRNIQEGISFLQTKESAIDDSISITQKLRELSTKYKNDVLSYDDKKCIEEEAESLMEHLYNINKSTKFNDKNVFDNHRINIQHGPNTGEYIDIGEDKIQINKKGNLFNFDTYIDYKKTKYFDKHNVSEFFQQVNATEERVLVSDDRFSDEIELTMNISAPYGYNRNNTVNVHLKMNNDLINNSSTRTYDLTGSFITNGNSYSLDGTCVYDNENKSLTGSFSTGGYKYEVQFTNIEKIEDIKNSNSFLLRHHGDSCFSQQRVNSVTLNSYKDTTYNSEQLKNLLENDKSEMKITVPSSSNKDKQYNVINGNIIVPNASEKVLQEYSVKDILENTDIIDKYMLDPLVKEKSSIGIKTNTLERLYNTQMVKEQLDTQSLSSLEDVDMARELINKSKNEIMQNVNLSLFSQSIENRRQSILQLLL